MSSFKEYDGYDALGLADLVRKKKISPFDICEEAISRIERLNPKINAVVTPMYDHARKAVKKGLPNGIFKGVPFLLKDLLAAYAGVPLTFGSKAYKNYIPTYDSELVQRFKNTGLIILGKTNTPEFGLMGITEPELYGPTRNPWNVDHTSGGSSGGSAAAVASGIVPIASGGDGGGSIRIPASCCGLFGMKPTRGRNPSGPYYGEIWQGAAVEHVISRSVRDSAAMLDAVHGADPGAPYIIQVPEQPYLKEIKLNPGRVKIAFSIDSPLGTEVHPECKNAVMKCAKLLEKLGHYVQEDKPDIDGKSLAFSYFTMYFGEVAADIAAIKSLLGKKAKRSDFEVTTWTLGLLGRTFTAEDFVMAKREWNKISRIMGNFHRQYTIFLTPTIAYPPVKIGELQLKRAERIMLNIINRFGLGMVLKKSGIVEELAIKSLEKTPFTQLANITGQPAMSVPLYWTKNGLPIGVQFIGPFGNEALLFRLAAQLEKASPWFKKRPPVT